MSIQREELLERSPSPTVVPYFLKIRLKNSKPRIESGTFQSRSQPTLVVVGRFIKCIAVSQQIGSVLQYVSSRGQGETQQTVEIAIDSVNKTGLRNVPLHMFKNSDQDIPVVVTKIWNKTSAPS